MPSKYDVTSFYALLSQNAHNAEVVGFPVPCQLLDTLDIYYNFAACVYKEEEEEDEDGKNTVFFEWRFAVQ